jgi:hypothetical protein
MTCNQSDTAGSAVTSLRAGCLDEHRGEFICGMDDCNSYACMQGTCGTAAGLTAVCDRCQKHICFECDLPCIGNDAFPGCGKIACPPVPVSFLGLKRSRRSGRTRRVSGRCISDSRLSKVTVTESLVVSATKKKICTRAATAATQAGAVRARRPNREGCVSLEGYPLVSPVS